MQKKYTNRPFFLTRQLFVLITMLQAAAFTQAQTNQIASPDKSITVTLQPTAGALNWQVAYHEKLLIHPSPPGLRTVSNDFAGPWRVDSSSAVMEITGLTSAQ
jgi:hypothetical protein